MKNNRKVYIIVINFGQWSHTIECLESIRTNNFVDFKVVIVDIKNLNQSLSKLSNWIKQADDKRFILVPLKENKGFAYANNVGIKEAFKNDDCEFFWILNNDTLIHPNALQHLFDYYKHNHKTRKIGFIGSKILDFEKKDIIQNVGGTFNPWTGYSTLIGMGKKDTGQFDQKDMAIDYIIGASMFFHKSLVDHTGLMPDRYFLYYEDIDWCITANKKGFKNITCKKSRVYHKQGISTGSKLLENDTHLNYKKHLYSSYLKLYQHHFKWLMPIAYIILFKQLAGRVFHRNFAEAKLILHVIFSKQ